MSLFAGSEALCVPPAQRVSLSLRNLTVSVKGRDSESGSTKILDNVSFDLAPSNMVAIMGGSGAGKTTLLNVLAQTTNINSPTLNFSGSVHYNVALGAEHPRISTAFMQQSDVFLPGLTLRETLDFQAQLRLPNATSAERKELIASLLSLLELDHRADEVVKTFTGTVSLSGGEQRRLSLAIQLLSKPQLLFLDEPTTGLDTTSALTLVSVLRKLASPEIGITIVLSIHQPRSEIVSLFDNLCVLTRGGRTVYYGSLSESLAYFQDLGAKNLVTSFASSEPFEVFNRIMALLVKNSISLEKEIETSRLVDSLVAEWARRHEFSLDIPVDKQKKHFRANLDVFKSAQPLPLHREVYILAKRTGLLSLRDTGSLIALLGGAVVLAIVLGWMFYKPTPNLSGIRSITSVMYAVLEIIGFAPLTMEIERLWKHDGVFFLKEYREKYVSAPGFILSRRLAKFWVEDLPVLIIFSSIAYFMWGLRVGDNYNDSGDGSYFGIFFTVVLLVSLVAMSTAMLCFFLGSSFAISTLYSNIFYQIQNSGSGYFVNSKTMPVYVKWVKYIAYFWYGFGALTSNQYSDWQGKCPYPQDDERCFEYSGNYQLSVLGFPQHWVGAPIGYLVIWFVGFNLMAYGVVKLKNFDVAVAKQRKNTIGGEDENQAAALATELSTAGLADEKETVGANGVSIHVRNVELAVKVRELRFSLAKTGLRTLLHGINANFQQNAVNVIMGPSGGGKTTFLNYLASRLPKTSSFSSTGQIYFNGLQEVTTKDISRISAYVTQHDNLLISHLTVRETLYHQALLRLPVEEHKYIPSQIAYLLRQTGLVDCADTPVGSASVKGISGGEKRRVSIAIQLLSRPKILFLDEPTSGLDVATSASILVMLNKLAAAGTTIISSIHQPSKELFDNFDSMVLLARGGYVVYNGPTAGIGQYLASLGYPCPDLVNMADFVLDVVSTQLMETKEAAKARVEHLISKWTIQQLEKEAEPAVGTEIDLAKFSKKPTPFSVAFRTVCKRQLLVSYRAKDVMFARISQITLLAAVYALFFAPMKNSQEGVSNRLGIAQSVVNLYFCGLINNISLYPSERDIFHQEYKDGTYNSFVFSFAYLFVELPFEIIPSIFFAVLVVFGIGLPRTAGMFFAMFYSSLVCVNAGESLGIIFNSMIQHLGLVTNVLSNLFMVVIFMAGTMSLQMPGFFKAMNYLSPIKYVIQICINMSFKNQRFRCAEGVESCLMDTGEAVLKQYKMKADVATAFGALTACLVIYRIIAVFSTYVRAKWFV